jgi:hypothetical protein
MVRIRYLGVIRPDETFGRYRAWRGELVALRGRCFPFREDYDALQGLIETLDRTATHFTGVEDFYGARAPWHSTPESGKRG